MMQYQRYYSTRATSQNQPIPGSDQVLNSAGGYAWSISDWERLNRFLILGSDSNTYYATVHELTVENAESVRRCIAEEGPRVVEQIVTVSDAGRAPKNEPALFALAMCAGLGDSATRRAALASLAKVARTGTHLFHFVRYVEAFRGWGRGLRQAVASWYNDMPAERLAYQMVKYQQRDGWSHRDVLRLAHPEPATEDHQHLYEWVTQGRLRPELPSLVLASERARKMTDARALAQLIREYRLPREAIPTTWLNEREIWAALLEDMPLTATLRNLGNLSKNGLLVQGAFDTIQQVCSRITDKEMLRKARIHPIGVLAALVTYDSGQGARGTGAWEPVGDVVDALNEAFYQTFENVEPTGQRWVLALDVSGSMNSGVVAGIPALTPRVASAAMAMVACRTEGRASFVAFCDKMVPLNLSRNQRLDDVVEHTQGLPFGGTDCALPMLWALENGVEADVFVVYTDNETWAGKIHPAQALWRYREQMGIPAKLVVVGMVSNGFSIAHPEDGGMLDCVGFDTATPQVMQEFVQGPTEFGVESEF